MICFCCPSWRSLLTILSTLSLQTCSSTLLNLNLVHLYKPATDFADLVAPSSGVFHFEQRGRADGKSRGLEDDWYLLDSRWLGARPRRLHHNPMADLANLFPCLFRLSLGITQLTGPMLMRLLYQTNLSELCLVQVWIGIPVFFYYLSLGSFTSKPSFFAITTKSVFDVILLACFHTPKSRGGWFPLGEFLVTSI